MKISKVIFCNFVDKFIITFCGYNLTFVEFIHHMR